MKIHDAILAVCASALFVGFAATAGISGGVEKTFLGGDASVGRADRMGGGGGGKGAAGVSVPPVADVAVEFDERKVGRKSPNVIPDQRGVGFPR